MHAPPTFGLARLAPNFDTPFDLQFDVDGDLLMSQLTYAENGGQIFRLAADGELKWSASILLNEGYEAAPVFPASDGGAFVASDRHDAVTRLGADGNLLWTRRIPAEWFADLSGNRVAVGNCAAIAVLDAQSGVILGHFDLPQLSYRCVMTGLQSTDDGEIYASIRHDSYAASAGSRALKFDKVGHLSWQFVVADDAVRLLGVDSVRVYLASDTRLSTLDSVSGTLAWQTEAMAARFQLVPGNPAIPVALGPDAVIGFAPTTGAIQWSQQIVATDVADAVGGALLVNTANGLVKLDAGTGTIAWTTTLSATDTFGNPVETWLAFGGLKDGQFFAVARVDAPTSQPPPLLQRIDFLNGQLAGDVALPPTLQRVTGVSALAGEQIVSITVEQDAVATKFRLSKIDAADGTEIWSRFLLPDPDLVDSGYGPGFSIAASGEQIAAVMAVGGYPRSRLAVGAWFASDGLSRWRVYLDPANEEWRNTWTSEPVIDSNSNVYISIASYIGCDDPDICAIEGLVKLAASDGAVLWRNEQSYITPGLEPPHVSPPAFLLLSSDVIVEAGTDLLRLNGIDGSVLWITDSSSLDAISSLHVAADGNILAVGFRRWAKLDAATGAILWSAPSPALSCLPHSCSVTRTVALTNGDLLQIGTTNSTTGGNNYMVALLHVDGSGTSELWVPGGDAPLAQLIRDVAVDADGEVWMQLREYMRGGTLSGRFLTRFDINSGSFLGRQAVGTSSYNVLDHVVTPIRWLAAPGNDRLPIVTFSSRPPIPATQGLALLDTSIAARGNLAVAANVVEQVAMPGERVHFQISVNYAGDASINDAQVDVVLPWGNVVTELSCSATSASNCLIDTASSNLRAHFAIDPGGELIITGAVTALDSPLARPILEALVTGPSALLEQDVVDNFAQVSVAQSLFHDGFEAAVLP